MWTDLWRVGVQAVFCGSKERVRGRMENEKLVSKLSLACSWSLVVLKAKKFQSLFLLLTLVLRLFVFLLTSLWEAFAVVFLTLSASRPLCTAEHGLWHRRASGGLSHSLTAATAALLSALYWQEMLIYSCGRADAQQRMRVALPWEPTVEAQHIPRPTGDARMLWGPDAFS